MTRFLKYKKVIMSLEIKIHSQLHKNKNLNALYNEIMAKSILMKEKQNPIDKYIIQKSLDRLKVSL